MFPKGSFFTICSNTPHVVSNSLPFIISPCQLLSNKWRKKLKCIKCIKNIQTKNCNTISKFHKLLRIGTRNWKPGISYKEFVSNNPCNFRITTKAIAAWGLNKIKQWEGRWHRIITLWVQLTLPPIGYRILWLPWEFQNFAKMRFRITLTNKKFT